ncbi:MAG: hypothetical protein RR988_04645 [Clostridia bacterium]
MKFVINKKKLEINESLLIIIIASIFSKNIYSYFKLYFLCYFFIIIHESLHLIVAKKFTKQIHGIRFGICGVNAEIDNVKDPFLLFIIKLAGPISNLILAFIFRNNALIFSINMILFFINMLPIYPLDGYDILKSILKLILLNKNIIHSIVIYTNFYALFAVWIVSIIFFEKFDNISLLIFTICVTLLNMRERKKNEFVEK